MSENQFEDNAQAARGDVRRLQASRNGQNRESARAAQPRRASVAQRQNSAQSQQGSARVQQGNAQVPAQRAAQARNASNAQSQVDPSSQTRKMRAQAQNQRAAQARTASPAKQSRAATAASAGAAAGTAASRVQGNPASAASSASQTRAMSPAKQSRAASSASVGSIAAAGTATSRSQGNPASAASSASQTRIMSPVQQSRTTAAASAGAIVASPASGTQAIQRSRRQGAQGGSQQATRVMAPVRASSQNPSSQQGYSSVVPAQARPAANAAPVKPVVLPGEEKKSKKQAKKEAKQQAKAEKAAQVAADKASKPKMSKGKKIGLGIGIGVLVLLIAAGIALLVGNSYLNKQLQGGKSDEELTQIKEHLATTSINEPFYMLLIGNDARAGESNEGARSDSTILARIDPVNHVVTLVSIQRDTKVDTEEYGTVKYNACYAYGGAASAIKYAKKICGVEISHYAEVSFASLTELIDAVGGIDVEVGETIDDWRVGDFVIPAGWQHLDGEKALAFARARYYGLGDYTRASNQRVVIQTLANKILSAPVTELPALIQSAAKCVSTSMSAYELYSLAMAFKGQNVTFYSANLPSTTATIDGASYVILDEEDAKSMMAIVDAGGDPKTVQLKNTSAIIDSNVLANAGTYEDQDATASTNSGTTSSSTSNSGSAAATGSSTGAGGTIGQ